jgi:hypothetical protein
MEDDQADVIEVAAGSVEDIRNLLEEIRQGLGKGKKATVSEYIRLLELLRDTELQTDAEVRVGWYDSLKDE